MIFNVWTTLSIAVILATMILQWINWAKFHKDGSNSTRLTMMLKEFFFLCHAIMLVLVTPAVTLSFSFWFSQFFGAFWFFGLLCLFFVYARGSRQ